MSIESDFQATLAAYTPLTTLVGTRIAQNAVSTPGRPLVVFITSHDRTLGLDNSLLADKCSISAQCWADTAAQADQVADAVQAALATGPAIAASAVVTDRSTVYDEELGADGTVLTVEWWL